jgi:hypothetical protein
MYTDSSPTTGCLCSGCLSDLVVGAAFSRDPEVALLAIPVAYSIGVSPSSLGVSPHSSPDFTGFHRIPYQRQSMYRREVRGLLYM